MTKNILKNDRINYSWIILAVTSLSVFFSGPGQTYFTSIFIESYINDFGWSRATISTLYSVSTLISGLLLFLVGRLTDKISQKYLTIFAALLLGASCMWNSFASSLWMLFIGFFISRLTGQGSLTLIPSTIVPQWFVRRRAFAFSLMSMGGVIGSSVLPPFNTWLIGVWGWSNAWRLWAVLLWVFFIPVVYLFLYDKPEDLGLLPDNGVIDSVGKADGASWEAEDESWTLKEAFRTRAFWGMLLCHILIPMITTGIVFHFISIMAAKGLSASSTSFILSMLAIVSFPITFLAGFLLDRIKMQHSAAILAFLQLLGLVTLLYSKSIYSIIAFAVVQGSAMGFHSVSSGVVWPNYFGMKHLGSIRGFIMTMIVIASAVGPIPFGIIYDMFGSYKIAIILMMLFPATGIAAAFLSKKPEK